MKLRSLATFVATALVLAFTAGAHAAVTVTDAWLRETIGAGRSSAGYAHIVNTGDADRLLAVSTPAAAMAEVHQSMEQGGMMRMAPVKALDIPAKGDVTLKPGGYHVMIMKAGQPLKVGETVDMTFTFEKAGKITVPAKVLPITASGPSGASGENKK